MSKPQGKVRFYFNFKIHVPLHVYYMYTTTELLQYIIAQSTCISASVGVVEGGSSNKMAERQTLGKRRRENKRNESSRKK